MERIEALLELDEDEAIEMAQEHGVLAPGQVWEHNVTGRTITIESIDQDDCEGLPEPGVYCRVEPYDEYEYIKLATRIFPQQLTLKEWDI